MAQARQYKVLLVGSGLMTPPLIDYLCKFGDTHITVASNILKDAQMMAARHPNNMSATYLDVFDVSKNNFTTLATLSSPSLCASCYSQLPSKLQCAVRTS